MKKCFIVSCLLLALYTDAYSAAVPVDIYKTPPQKARHLPVNPMKTIENVYLPQLNQLAHNYNVVGITLAQKADIKAQFRAIKVDALQANDGKEQKVIHTITRLG